MFYIARFILEIIRKPFILLSFKIKRVKYVLDLARDIERKGKSSILVYLTIPESHDRMRTH